MNFEAPSFESYLNVLNLQEIDILSKECIEIFSAKDKGQKYSSGQTFWIGYGETPSSNVECFALRCLKHYLKGRNFGEGTGAEFWPLVMNTIDDVGPHYDKDYGAEDEGKNIFPFIGTVTYLSDVGCPTIFLQQREDDPLPCIVNEAFVSNPEKGKQVCFDGRFLHCGSSSLLSKEQRNETEKKRVTLLINIWINHRPSEPIRCSFGSKCTISEEADFPKSQDLKMVELSECQKKPIKMSIDKKRYLKFHYENIYGPTVRLRWNFDEGCIVDKEKKKKKKEKEKKKNQKNMKKK